MGGADTVELLSCNVMEIAAKMVEPTTNGWPRSVFGVERSNFGHCVGEVGSGKVSGSGWEWQVGRGKGKGKGRYL